LRGRFADSGDFWSRTQLDQLHGDDGTLDMAKVSAQADELLTEHPHWRAGPVHGAAPGDLVNAGGKIGYPPSSVLDTDTVDADGGPRDWAGFLQAAARGE